MKEVFLIEQLKIDNAMILSCNAVSYKPIGWVSSLGEAEGIVRKGKTFTRSDSWAISEPMYEFRFRKLKSMK